MLCQPRPDTEYIENQSSLCVKQSVLTWFYRMNGPNEVCFFFHNSVSLSALPDDEEEEDFGVDLMCFSSLSSETKHSSIKSDGLSQ